MPIAVRLWFALTVVVSGGFAVRASGADPAQTAHHWNVGRTVYVEWREEVRTSVDAEWLPGGESSEVIRSTWGYWQTVTASQPDNSVRIIARLDRIALEGRVDGAPVMIDTDLPLERGSETGAGQALLRAALGESITMDVSFAGRVTKWAGLDTLRATIESAATTEHARADPAYGLLLRELTEQSQRLRWEQHFALLGFDAPTTGQSWTRAFRDGPRVIELRYRVEDVNTEAGRRLVQIAYAGTNQQEPRTTTEGTPEPVQFEYGASRIEGAAVYDITRGLLRGQQSTLDRFRTTAVDPETGQTRRAFTRRTSEAKFIVQEEAERRAQRAPRKQ